jgi:CO/xanthine dehydrogenase Mo-binding subunit
MPGVPKDTNLVKGTSNNAYLTDWDLPGDVEQGFKDADNVIEMSWRREENFQGVPAWHDLAIWGNIRNNQSSNGPFLQWWSYTPGNFGAGMLTNTIPSGLASLMAAYTGRNVMVICHPRQGLVNAVGDESGEVKMKVGFKNDGTITSVQLDTMYFNRTYQSGIQWLLGCTKIPNLKINYNAAYVDRPINLPNRSEQRVNTSTYDLVMGYVAAALKMDPTEVVMKNNGWDAHGTDYLEQYATEHGFKWVDSLAACIKAGKAAIEWDKYWTGTPGTKQLANGNLQGLGFCGGYENWHSQSFSGDCGLSIDDSGKVHMITTQTEYGSAHNTTYAGVVAEELGCTYSDVHMRPNHPYDSFVTFNQGGSGGCACNTHAVKKAAQMLKPQVLQLACLEHIIPTAIDSVQDPAALTMTSLFPGLTPDDLDLKNGYVFEKAHPDNKQPLSLVASRMGKIGSGSHVGRIFGFGYQGQGIYGETGHPRPEMSRQCTMALIEVDPETGQIIVKKAVGVNDVGKIIQPEACEGQIYGGLIMGISRQLMEEFIYDASTGIKLNDNLIDYKMFTIMDIPEVEAHALENELGYGAYGCTGVGENQSDAGGQSVATALYDATGKWVTDWPMTPDKVLKALGKV